MDAGSRDGCRFNDIGVNMLAKIGRLLRHPGFQQRPLTTLARCGYWAAAIALGGPRRFQLTPGGAVFEVKPTLRYTELSAFVMRDATEPELQHLDRLLQSGGTFLDVGANIGLYSLRAAHIVGPTGRVVAVEPSADAHAALLANIARNPWARIEVVKAAVSDMPGEVELFHTAGGYDPQAFSLVSDGTASGSETVQAKTIDQIVEEQGLTALDCIKLDVEGVEDKAIAGAAATIARFSPAVILEMNGGPQGRPDVEANPAWHRLAGLGYRFYRFRRGGELYECPTMPVEHQHYNVVARRR